LDLSGRAGGWRRLHSEELHNLYSSPNIIRGIKSCRMRWVGSVALMGVTRNAYKMLVGGPKGKRRLEGPRCRWEDIRMNFNKYCGKLWTGFICFGLGTSNVLL